MTRPRTASVDAQILALLDAGLAPKEVAARLKLKNKWRVYRARRRSASAILSAGERDMPKVEILKKELKGYAGDAWLVKKGTQHYVVSGTNVPAKIKAQYLRAYPELAKSKAPWFEVMAYESDAHGRADFTREICGGRGFTHEEVIEKLKSL